VKYKEKMFLIELKDYNYFFYEIYNILKKTNQGIMSYQSSVLKNLMDVEKELAFSNSSINK